jgi:hypothetical protein
MRQSKMPGCPLPTLRTRSGIRTLPTSFDKGVDLERVRYRLGHGDLTTTTRYVKILDEEDSTAADAIATILGDVTLENRRRQCERP